MSIHVCKCIHNGREEYHLRYPGMTQKAAQELADKINADALAEPAQPCKYPHCDYPCQDLPDCRDAEQPAQQQEPVAYAEQPYDTHAAPGQSFDTHSRMPPNVPTARASKPWVGLTDDEIQKEFHPLHATGLQFARSIEAKLKEKNT